MRLLVCLTLAAAAVSAQTPQRVRLTVERRDEKSKAWSEVNAATVFAQGEHLRFRLTANFNGFLYVMNHGTSGGYELLFPRSDTGSENRMQSGKDYLVPASQGYFAVSGPAGQDVVYWV